MRMPHVLLCCRFPPRVARALRYICRSTASLRDCCDVQQRRRWVVNTTSLTQRTTDSRPLTSDPFDLWPSNEMHSVFTPLLAVLMARIMASNILVTDHSIQYSSVAKRLRYLIGQRKDRGSNPGWFGHLSIVDISWADTTWYSLFLLKVPLNTIKPTNQPTILSDSQDSISLAVRMVTDQSFLVSSRPFARQPAQTGPCHVKPLWMRLFYLL